MKLSMLALVFAQNVFAVNQHAVCTNSDTDTTVCWSTANVCATANGIRQVLDWLPLELPNDQAVYTNADRKLIVQELFPAQSYLLIDSTGRKFKMECGRVAPGNCP